MSVSGTVTELEPDRQLNVGTAPVNWNNNDLPNWRPLIPFPDILDAMLDAGFLETEWDESFGAQVDDLNDERRRRGMSFTGAYRWFDLLDEDHFARDVAKTRPLLETLQSIGVRHLIVSDRLREHRVACSGFVPDDGSVSLDDSGFAAIGGRLAHLASIADAYDLKVHYHNHAGTYIETPAEVRSLISHLDLNTVDLCFDTGHYAFGGGDALDFIGEHYTSIEYLHLKDVDPEVLQTAKANRWSFLEALKNYVFCPLGQGNANIREVIELLVRERFGGYVIIEQDTCRGDATENGRRNLATFLSLATAAPSKGRIET